MQRQLNLHVSRLIAHFCGNGLRACCQEGVLYHCGQSCVSVCPTLCCVGLPSGGCHSMGHMLWGQIGWSARIPPCFTLRAVTGPHFFRG